MPWRQEPMKDVVHCDKLRVAVSRLRSADFRMGEPTWAIPRYPRLNKIGRVEGTGRTETSKYPEEERLFP